jgi:uncharacterized protein (DUF1330 family)
MRKGYWIVAYRSAKDAEKLGRYIELAAPVLERNAARFIVRGVPARVYEDGIAERTVVIEFESVAKAIEVYESAEYQAAVAALGDGAERDLRVIEAFQ